MILPPHTGIAVVSVIGKICALFENPLQARTTSLKIGAQNNLHAAVLRRMGLIFSHDGAAVHCMGRFKRGGERKALQWGVHAGTGPQEEGLRVESRRCAQYQVCVRRMCAHGTRLLGAYHWPVNQPLQLGHLPTYRTVTHSALNTTPPPRS